jgi:hypothetical protein
MAATNDATHPPGKHRYRSVADGMSMAQAFLRSGLGISSFARQYGASARMVKYRSTRAQVLAAASEAAAAPSPPLLEHVASVDDASILPVPSPTTAPPEPPPPLAPDPGRIEIILPDGTRLVVSGSVSQELLRHVVLSLTGRAC